MISYPQFDFAAPPGVYSHWFVYVCCKAGLMPACHFPTQLIPPPVGHSRFVLSMVRHPLTWLHAYYEKVRGSETKVPEVDVFRECYRGSQNRFPMFVDSYLKRCPGAITRMYQAYRASNVMRVEDLPGAAVDFLRSVDVPTAHFEQYVFGAECGWMHDKDLRRSVVSAERDFCLDYDYW